MIFLWDWVFSSGDTDSEKYFQMKSSVFKLNLNDYEEHKYTRFFSFLTCKVLQVPHGAVSLDRIKSSIGNQTNSIVLIV